MKIIEYVEVCGGIGGFSLGIEEASKSLRRTEQKMEKRRDSGNTSSRRIEKTKQGIFNKPRCAAYYDNDRYAVQTFNKNFKTNYKPTDIRKVPAESVPRHDILCAGFPCQTFSIAGKRMGFEDTRGTIFFDIARIAKAKQPQILFLENVKGLLSHDNGRTFATILATLDEMGYNAEWQVLNSKHFGVPQNRERVFIIGHLRGKSGRQVFPIGESNEMDTGEQGQEEVSYPIDANYYKGATIKDFVEKRRRQLIMTQNSGKEIARIYDKEGLAPTLKGKTGGWQEPKILDNPSVIGMIKQTAKKRTFDTPKEINDFLKEHKARFTIKEIAEYLKLPKTQVEHYFRSDDSRAIPEPNVWWNLKELLGFPSTYDREVTDIYTKEIEFEQTRRVWDANRISPTINATEEPKILALDLYNKKAHSDRTPALTEPHHNTLRLLHQNRIRRLTPIECERLQGFPDNWTEGVSDTQRYKQLGNAVTVNVIEAIARKMIYTIFN